MLKTGDVKFILRARVIAHHHRNKQKSILRKLWNDENVYWKLLYPEEYNIDCAWEHAAIKKKRTISMCRGLGHFWANGSTVKMFPLILLQQMSYTVKGLFY